jgi:hypothetical protein
LTPRPRVAVHLYSRSCACARPASAQAAWPPRVVKLPRSSLVAIRGAHTIHHKRVRDRISLTKE